jgi:small subunit ribosomal protein S8
MSVSDPIANMLTKIRNGCAARKDSVVMPASNLKLEVIKILRKEGYIKNFEVDENDKKKTVEVFLKYDEDKKSVIHGIQRESKSGRRVYTGYREMPRVYNGFGTLIVSTSAGVITGKTAADKKVGGEIICTIW